MFACLVMGTRYRPIFAFAGAAAAFAVAVAAGSLLALLPYRPAQLISAVLFLIGAVLLWRQHGLAGARRGQHRDRPILSPVNKPGE